MSPARLIEIAAQMLGGADPVRTALCASAEDFASWQAGHAPAPRPVYERLVELVVSEQARLIDSLQQQGNARADAPDSGSGGRMVLTIRSPF